MHAFALLLMALLMAPAFPTAAPVFDAAPSSYELTCTVTDSATGTVTTHKAFVPATTGFFGGLLVSPTAEAARRHTGAVDASTVGCLIRDAKTGAVVGHLHFRIIVSRLSGGPEVVDEEISW